ncbi:MAG: SxtJ family membrane protein [Acidobacteriota bacterium]|nr:SxtJ family membrane protein [Acidobacteriota bacterium]
MIELNRDPTPKQLRWFAGLVFPLFCVWIGWLLHSQLGATATAKGLVGFGLAVAVVGVPIPTVARWVWLATMVAVFPIGFVLSHVLLAVVYYVLFTLVGLALRIAGKDPMTRELDRDAKTYWITRDKTIDIERYFRQY